MRDPIGAFDVIKENFVRYVKTAFGTRFQGFEDERDALLDVDKVLCREPWMEPLPDYKSSGKGIEALTAEDLGNALNGEQLRVFKTLVQAGLFPSTGTLYHHQAVMLKAALQGKNCVITSGTGSGKTESFLLPLFAQLSKEVSTWPRPGVKSPHCDTWWNNLTPTQIVDRANDFRLSADVQQRAHETRPAGVRALILYPMNALVEDQMSRLRRALDSTAARTVLETTAHNNAVYFGRYNGNTPVPGDLKILNRQDTYDINKNKVRELTDALQQLEKASGAVTNYVASGQGDADELHSFFQRLDGAEMRCRFDMQISPPDILITNYSMLSIMMMRDVDAGVFEKTRAWLAAEDLSEAERAMAKQERVFHLVIDELHLYRGTQGTEVAYLLKLVLDRLGLHPHHSQLRILASSASLEPGDPQSIKFLEDFFGIDSTVKRFEIIRGENNPVEALEDTASKLPASIFSPLAKAYNDEQGNDGGAALQQACEACADALARFFAVPPRTENGVDRLRNMLRLDVVQLRARLYAPCGNNNTHRAVCAIGARSGEPPSFAETFFTDYTNEDHLRDALRGLLIARSLCDDTHVKLPRFRFHYFFRNIEGVWASVKATDVDEAYRDEHRTMGRLYAASRIRSDRGYRVLEVLYCDNCGTTFFGGSRLKREDGSFELLPVSPNIEGIPEKTPAKLVEKRSYQEFALFWPKGNQEFVKHEEPHDYWRQATLNGLDQTNYSASWHEGSLNVYSGDVRHTFEKATNEPDNWIKGYYYTVKTERDPKDVMDLRDDMDNPLETHKAIPCVCPGCGLNHQKPRSDSPKSKTSSVRGFRTGFAKTTQMFAKELLYQLPDNKRERKLVVFSDSREDAAQVANGIERNHFSDIVREIVTGELRTAIIARHDIVHAFDARDNEKKQVLRSANPTLYDEIEYLVNKADYTGENSMAVREKLDAQKILAEFRNRLVPARSLINITNSIDLAPLVNELVQLGINPAGVDIGRQTKPLNGDYVPWFALIDFQTSRWRKGVDLEFIEDIKRGAFDKLAKLFFGNLFYSFESSGLGYLSLDPSHEAIPAHVEAAGLTRQDFIDVTNSVIRMLGDRYKHNHAEEFYAFRPTAYTGFPRDVRKYIQEVANLRGLSVASMGDAIFEVLTATGLLRERGIQIEELFVKIAVSDDRVWSAEQASRPHLHRSGGVCTNSLTPLLLESHQTCRNVWEENYLSHSAIIQNRKAIRLHCEELTGQTDNQFERQRHFRNIVLGDEGPAVVREIDLLSVTTTLEVGVDIGALQAVMLANMPPQRFNYQQRVGRAGRRGQAYSAILTFCRGRSHDEFYFSNPQKITGDAPPTPFLTMGLERIYKRLLAKEILRRAYLTVATNVNHDEDRPSVHGNFGKITNWAAYKTQVEAWIQNNQTEVARIVDFLLTPALRRHRDALLQWACDVQSPAGLISRISEVISDQEIATDDISEKLAEGGVLPMFGMPTTVRNLYHGINRKLELLAIDRPQSMAIYEFAPGSQKTKDKAIHTAIGFTSDFIKRKERNIDVITNASTDNRLPFSLDRWMLRCKSCGFNQTYAAHQEPMGDACPVCQNQHTATFSKFIIRTPRGYRTNLLPGNDSKDDSELLLSRPPVFAERTDDANNPDLHRQHANAALTLSDKDVTWRVNTNADKLFKGKLYNALTEMPPTYRFTFQQQWLVTNLATRQVKNGYTTDFSSSSREEHIALAANKNTEIFRLSPTSVPLELDLNMFTREADPIATKAMSYGVRAGFYSAAFLLQRMLASRLDVDPTEIEIADIVMKTLTDGTDRRTAEIVMTDELPNGSGFVRHLYENFENILNETLAPTDADSYAGKIHSTSHGEHCSDACYECLKIYRNMNYHSLLDWRLGMSVLRVHQNPLYACGADGDFDRYPETRGWLQFATSLLESFATSFGYDHPLEVNGLPIIRTGRNQRNTIAIVHPFWNFKDIKIANWLAEVKAELEVYNSASQGKIFTVDTFNLLRRPGWCYEKLVTA